MAIKGVGIDLGTTYSCVAVLNDQGLPVTVPNEEGELSTPSVVFFDGKDVIVGTQAQQNALIQPDRVISHCKRYMGDPRKTWTIDRKQYTPTDVSGLIVSKLLHTVEHQFGKVDSAVITVPAQFSDAQREATIQAGYQAGLKEVSIINEPVAAALCYVLGDEGLWFSELADEQNIYVFDLGGGTLDLAIIRYKGDDVTVIASGGDLHLGGLNFNELIRDSVCTDFSGRYRVDPRLDPESLQELENRVEQLKRSLSVRTQAKLICQHDHYKQSYEFTQDYFKKLCQRLLTKIETHTVGLLKSNKMGWAHINAVLTVGGASRMPMIRDQLKQLSGRTLNTSLSPDQSIAHGAAYFSGMLKTDSETAQKYHAQQSPKLARLARMKQTSVNARALGFLVRDAANQFRVPHYILPANTALPAQKVQIYGTVVPNQSRVKLNLVESGPNIDDPYSVLGECILEPLPPGLPEDSSILVTLKYNSEARVEVEAVVQATGMRVSAVIVRGESAPPAPQPPVNSTKLPSGQQAKRATRVIDPFEELLDHAPLADSLPDVRKLSQQNQSKSPSKPKPKPSQPVSRKDKQDDIIDMDEIYLEPMELDDADFENLVKEELPIAELIDDDNESLLLEADYLIEESERPVLLCNHCGRVLNAKGECADCDPTSVIHVPNKSTPDPRRRKPSQQADRNKRTGTDAQNRPRKPASPQRKPNESARRPEDRANRRPKPRPE